MQGGLSASDRKLLLGAGVVIVLLLTITATLEPPVEQAGFEVPTTYSSRSGGARAAYLLLLDLQYPVHRWEQPPNYLPKQGTGTLLILAEPSQGPSEPERQALRAFLRSGGRILFCGASIHSFFAEADLVPTPFPEWKEFEPALPSSLSPGAQKIVMRPTGYWRRTTSAQLALYGDRTNAAVVSWQMGAGELIWWAGATPLTNAGIARADNLRFFLNSIGRIASPSNIYWDEYFHGQQGSLWSYVQQTPIAWAVLQLAIAAAFVLFTFSRRSGPEMAPALVSRLSPLEFVDTMGGLYQRAGAASVPVGTSYRHLRSSLTRRLGLPAITTDEALAAAAGDRLGWKRDEVRETLVKAAAALRIETLSAREALPLVRDLERSVVRLNTIRPEPQEKK